MQKSNVQYFEEYLRTLQSNQEIELSMVQLSEYDDDESQKICAALSQGFSLILDFTWSGNEVVQDLVSNMSLPYIHIDVSIAAFLILLDSYLDNRNSTDILIIFDKEEYIDQALYHWLDSTRLRMVMAEPLDRTMARKIKQIRPIPNSFAIIASTANMPEILSQAIHEGLLDLPDRWNLVFTDFQATNFDRSLLYNQSVSLIYLNSQLCHDLLKDDHCPEDFELNDRYLQWMAVSIDKLVHRLLEERLKFPTMAFECMKPDFPDETKQRFDDVFEAILMDNSNILTLQGKSVHLGVRGKVEKMVNGSFQVIAQYKDGNLLLEPEKQFDPIRAFYRIGITHALPWSYKEQNAETGEYFWTGYCVDFVKKLAEVMNFAYEFVEPAVGTFGEKVNGTWNGVVGDLAVGDIDMAVTAIIMTADKEEVIDFVAPYYEQTGITIVMRKPVRKTSLFKFMTVLKLEVWLSIVAALIVTGFMIWFLDKYSPYSARNNKKAYPYPCREFTLKESFWFALTSFTPQGGGEAPKALSGRTLVAAYWLFVVLMLATFTANLAAFLTVERMQAPVQSLEQLARQSRINYTVVRDSETHKYFINMKFAEDTLYRMWKELTLNASTDDTRYRVWDYPIREQYGHILLAINDSNPVDNATEGFRITDEHLDADFAFIHDSSEIRYEISKNCNLTEVGEVFAEKPYAVAVQQGSHLQDDLSKVILDLQKNRFFERLQSKYWNNSAKDDCPSTDDNEGITLESLGGVFIATLFGLALAMVTLAGEVWYYRRRGQREKEQMKVQKSKNLPGTIPGLLKLPKPSVAPVRLDGFKPGASVTIGTTFNPVNLKGNLTKELESVNISHISLYPKARNRITRVD
ncbi:ionotropic receptor 25a [Euwallacea similis]|uniref:ionotropic receptor 25a n=1 Tax=Euwallacea similis TaxID=1736056 RepID=UPI00344B37A7